jgi:hypothetical protein
MVKRLIWSDCVRLQRAVILKKAINHNDGRANVNFKNFSIGKQLLMPEANVNKVQLIDPEVTKYFYDTKRSSAELIGSLPWAVNALEAALESPKFQYLKSR